MEKKFENVWAGANSKTTFVTVNQTDKLRRVIIKSYSKTTFVTVNQ